jgi:hypothetical protein
VRCRATLRVSVKIVLCAQLARRDEGSDWVSRLLDLQPGLIVAVLKAYAVKFLGPEVLEIYIENLRKAGLPEGRRRDHSTCV